MTASEVNFPCPISCAEVPMLRHVRRISTAQLTVVFPVALLAMAVESNWRVEAPKTAHQRSVAEAVVVMRPYIVMRSTLPIWKKFAGNVTFAAAGMHEVRAGVAVVV